MAKPIHMLHETSSLCGRLRETNGIKVTVIKENVTCVNCLKQMNPEKNMSEVRDMLVNKDVYTNVKSRA